MCVVEQPNIYVKLVLPIDTLYLFRNPKETWEFSITRCDAYLNKEYNNQACSLRTKACLYGPCEVYNNAEVYDFRKCYRTYIKEKYPTTSLIDSLKNMSI